MVYGNPQCPVRSRTSFATVVQFGSVLYSFDPIFAPFLLTIRRNAFAILMFRFHSLFYCFFASAFMFLTCADFSGSWLYSWLSDGPVAPFLASLSARSLSSISECPGTHIIVS